MHEKNGLLFLKLGGSLITDKAVPRKTRRERIAGIAAEIADWRADRPGIPLLLGHGSGSFGHVPAKKYGTRQGVAGAVGWQGFVEVWRMAARLNSLVVAHLHDAGLPAVSFPPSAFMMANDGAITRPPSGTIKAALDAGLLPVVFGDVAFDRTRGGTIVSTEDVFRALAPDLQPELILLAGIEPGVWADYPGCTTVVDTITPSSLNDRSGTLGPSALTDVTGGMASKVREMLDLVRALPGLEVLIFGGLEPGSIRSALAGEARGTLIRGDLR